MKRKSKRANNGSGSFYFDKNRNSFVYKISYVDYNGVKKRRAFYGKSKVECLEKAEKFLEVKSRKLTKNQEEITLADVLQAEYDLKFEANEIKESTYVRKLYTIYIVNNSNLADIPIIDITLEDIQKFLNSLTNRSNSDIDKIYSSINLAFRIAVDDGIIPRNPLTNHKIKKSKSKKADKNVDALTIDEQRLFLEGLNEYKKQNNRNYYKNQFLIELYTGLRMGEINALTPKDIDFDEMEIHVTNTITKDINSKPKIGATTKTKKGYRTVPIPKVLVPILEDALNNYIPNDNDLLFVNVKTMGPIGTTQVNSTFNRICKRQGIRERGQHCLRHTFATRCIESGVQATTLKNFLGHTDITTTLNDYVNVFQKFQKNELSVYEKYLDENFGFEYEDSFEDN